MSRINKISASASKSYLQRALAISILCKGSTILKNVSWCDDSTASKKIIEQLGASVKEKNRILEIQSEGLTINNTIFNASESGLALRMFSPILALQQKEVILNGEGSLQKRPVQMIADALSQLKVSTNSNKHSLPLSIQGPIQPNEISIDGSISSQILTGLLISLPLVNGDSRINVTNLKSRPYIDMTINIIRRFGVEIENITYNTFIIKGNQKYTATNYNIEGDWSSAAFFLVYGAVKNTIEVDNLNPDSLQADKSILIALERAGAKVFIKENSIIVEKDKLKAFDFDATDSPDLFPPLVCLASQCEGVSSIKGTSRLIHKESNRAKVLQSEFKKMGIEINIKDDIMTIEGGKIKACTINSYQDHRIAMSFFCLGQLLNGNVEIKNFETVNTSFSKFLVTMKKIGAKYEIKK